MCDTAATYPQDQTASSSLDHHPPTPGFQQVQTLSLGRSLELKLAQQDPAHTAPWTAPPEARRWGEARDTHPSRRAGRREKMGVLCSPQSGSPRLETPGPGL